MTAAQLALRIRMEQIDLCRSVVMLVGGAPAGQTFLAVRGERGWRARLGVLPAFRGQGLSHRLTAAIIEQARQVSER
jgi:GNAT superfamily N-acetyltransferase